MTLDKIENILERLGYPINFRGPNYIGTTALFRNGDNSLGLLCYEDGPWDQIETKKYNWIEFVSRVKKISPKEAEEFLGGAEFEDGNQEEKEEKVKTEKVLVESDYADLINSYKFFLDRGISEDILRYYGCGLAQGGPMYGRVIFKIRNDKGKLIGVTGRDVLNRTATNSNIAKWKHKGQKSDWIYPCFQRNLEAIKRTGQIIIVESIGDLLALNNAGVWNILVNFGLSLSPARLAFLLKINPSQIFLGLNNDQGEINRGQVAAEKVKAKLLFFFSADKIVDSPPFLGDFGDMKKEEIREWIEKYKIKL